MNRNSLLLCLLKICSVFVFFGRAYEHIFFDAPYRSLLWDEVMFSAVVEGLFNMKWEEYVTDISIDATIQSLIVGIGGFYFICGIASIFINAGSSKILKYIIVAGACSLISLAVLQAKSRFYHAAMFFEHAIQFGSPVALLWYFKIKQEKPSYILFLKVIIAVSFISHGLYAIGWPYPIPGNFVTMTMNILVVTENFTKSLLLLVGFLDFLVAIFIFFPKTMRRALVYAIIWGLLTAFARITSGLTYDFSPTIFHQYLFTTLYRIPHGLLPLFTYLLIFQYRKKNV